MPIDIVDLFAGPGGLGEGFSQLDNGKAFKILVSAEMEPAARSTLRLRSFFRGIRHDSRALKAYYAFCNGTAQLPYEERSETAWIASGLEARRLTLGDPADNGILDGVLDTQLDRERPWVLIGGPPCQAYSIVGRSRNIGTASYRPENDHRHFLYKEYLRIIRDRRPPVFVMENVKGILSSRVGGKRIFDDILRDLADPDGVFGQPGRHHGYRIHSLVSDVSFERGMDPRDIDLREFIIKSEEFGIPQTRHRVILLGIRTDVKADFSRLKPQANVNVHEVIDDLPPLRSRLSKGIDNADEWEEIVRTHLVELADDARKRGMTALATALRQNARGVRTGLTSGANRMPRLAELGLSCRGADRYVDPKLTCWLNHEARAHMTGDLRRYAYAATYAALFGQSPNGHEQFALAGLAPNHKNWETGTFSDRFRVQRYKAPASTITSHIAKDGHYFIHPDPTQCRSLSVREAARIQTFPDNYFFQGNRTEQYHQVGNAVPPLLALKIAGIVKQILV